MKEAVSSFKHIFGQSNRHYIQKVMEITRTVKHQVLLCIKQSCIELFTITEEVEKQHFSCTQGHLSRNLLRYLKKVTVRILL